MPRGRILLECLVHPGFKHVDMARLPELVTKHLFERQTVRELSDPLGVLVGFAGLARTAVVSLDPSDYFPKRGATRSDPAKRQNLRTTLGSGQTARSQRPHKRQRIPGRESCDTLADDWRRTEN